METFSLKKILIAVSFLLSLGEVQASSSFNSQAQITFDFGLLPTDVNVVGSFEQLGNPDSWTYVSGDGLLAANNPSTSLTPNVQHTFSINGTVSNGTVTSSHIGRYKFVLSNTSVDSDYTIAPVLIYDLSANALGDFADSDVNLNFYDESYTFANSELVIASVFGAPTSNANGTFAANSFTLSANTITEIYADVVINGSLEAAPVPVPAAAWSFLAGLMGVLAVNKRKAARV